MYQHKEYEEFGCSQLFIRVCEYDSQVLKPKQMRL